MTKRMSIDCVIHNECYEVTLNLFFYNIFLELIYAICTSEMNSYILFIVSVVCHNRTIAAAGLCSTCSNPMNKSVV